MRRVKAVTCIKCGDEKYRRSYLCRIHYNERIKEKHAKLRKIVIKACEYCENRFKSSRKTDKYCNQKCSDKARLKRDRIYPLPSISNCKHCNKEFLPKTIRGKYCGHKCKEIARSFRRFPLENRKKIKFRVEACRQCSTEFKVPEKEYKRRTPRFCSLKCWYDSNKIEGSEPDDFPKDPRGWLHLAEEIRQAYGNRCAQCGNINERRKLSVDHIIPRRVIARIDLYPHWKWNLIPLCNSCHTKKTRLEVFALYGLWEDYARELKLLGYPMGRFKVAIREFFKDCGLLYLPVEKRLTLL